MALGVVVKSPRTLLARILPGESVMAGFLEILRAHGVERTAVLSGIGSLVTARFLGVQPGAGRPFRSQSITHLAARGPFEILTLEGNAFPSDEGPVVHLHVTLGCADGRVLGGHLVDGAVYTTVELLLLALDGCRVGKARDAVAGGIQLAFPAAAGSARARPVGRTRRAEGRTASRLRR
jgi:uncharacterized protein